MIAVLVELQQFCVPALAISVEFVGQRQSRSFKLQQTEMEYCKQPHWQVGTFQQSLSCSSSRHCSTARQNKKYKSTDCESTRLISEEEPDRCRTPTAIPVNISAIIRSAEFEAALQNTKPGRATELYVSGADHPCWSFFVVLVA